MVGRPTAPLRGACSHCGRVMRVTKAGVVGHHVDLNAPDGGMPWRPRCAGAGRPPAEPDPVRRKSPKENLRWHLAMKYHVEGYPGHGTEKTDTCYECGQIEALVRDWQGAVLDSLARPE